ncbi:MAG: hypothetical protein PQJ58_08265 [Spirochaetales bacterium]|nr:hypothetical protein [Spirochaetales bacterium]
MKYAERNKELIREKASHIAVLKMLRFVESHHIQTDSKVLTLPGLSGHGYSSYRLMIDNEKSDPAFWTVVEDIDGNTAEFGTGDKIITSG